MINTTKIKIPKKYQHMLETVEHDSDGYWAYTDSGYKFESMGCHTASTDTQAQLLEDIRTIVPCDCPSCTDYLEGKTNGIWE